MGWGGCESEVLLRSITTSSTAASVAKRLRLDGACPFLQTRNAVEQDGEGWLPLK
jgi:hypothetical protein